jgi:sugar phosphate permease
MVGSVFGAMTRRATQWRWLLWGVLAGGFLLVNFHRVSTAVISGSLASTFNTTGAELGLLHASFFYIYAALQLPAGLLVDRYGPRNIAAAGLLVMSAGATGFALAPTFTIGFVARAFVGLGGSVLYIATLRFLANWYRPDEFATMTGWTVAAAGLGGVLATTPLAIAVDATDWRVATAIAALVGAAFTIAVYLLVRDEPADAGFEPIAGVSPPKGVPDLTTVISNTKSVLTERETWLMGGLLFFTIGTNFTVLGLWGVPYVVDVYNVGVGTASGYVLVGNLGLLMGSPVIGSLSDRVGRRTPLIVASVGVFVLAYGLIFLTVRPPLIVFGAALFIAQFVTGGTLLSYTVAKERHSAAASGTVTGLINGIGYFGAAVFPAAMGAALDAYWTGALVDGARSYTAAGYRVAFGIAVVAGLVALICAIWLHIRVQREPVVEQGAVPADD